VDLRIQAVVETSLYVADLGRSVQFYSRLFGFEQIYEESDRMRALNVAGRQVLLLFRIGGSTQATNTPNGLIPPHDGSGTLHLAFAIQENDLDGWREHLRNEQVPIESEVHCGGHSLYFRDPDGHLLELITPGCWPIY
jgi:catechol-2,3-dioxygenase